MGDYNASLKKGLISENIIENFIAKSSKYQSVKYISIDKMGNQCWQQIDTVYGKLRHPDFKINSRLTKELVLLIEVKSFREEYQNINGYVSGMNKNWKTYLSIEKDKFDDYLKVQSHYEVPCKIVFVVGGEDNEERRFYWDTLDNLKKSVDFLDRPYGPRTTLCYIWDIYNILNWSLDNLLDE